MNEMKRKTVTNMMVPYSQPLSIHQKMNFVNTNVVSIMEPFWQVRCQIRLEVLRGSFALHDKKGPSQIYAVSKINPSLSIITNSLERASPITLPISFSAQEAMEL